MGNGGCGCSVTNIDLALDPTHFKKSNIKYLELDLTKIDMQLCKDCDIGPFIINGFSKKMNLKFAEKSLTYLNEILQHLNHPNKFQKINKIDMIIDYSQLTSKTNLLRLYSKILTMPQEKLKQSLIFSWNNTLRVLLYLIILLVENKHRHEGSFTKYKTDTEMLTLKDNLYINTNDDENSDDIFLDQINKDIPRTFSNYKITTNQAFTTNLREILLAMAMNDKVMGYVQGMNYIAAFILILTGNEKNLSSDLFKSVLNMHSNIYNMRFKEMFTNNFPLLFKYLDRIKEIIKEENRSLSDKILELQFSDFLWASQWVQTLFIYKMDFMIAIKLWDIIIAYGIDVIMVLTPIILEFFQKRLLKAEIVEEFLNVLEDFYNMRGYDYSEFVFFIYKRLNENKYKKYLISK